ncbi:VOC family protein [Actinomadura nitritigenes]|uniref:VOC family protein n=1 Tax=Actinomadura nitritigenes TaxID=134602 RepID=UPI003695D7C7
MFADPEGADFSVIDTHDFSGVRVVDEPSAPVWVELAARDVAVEREFYGQVFGWQGVERDYDIRPYTEFRKGGEAVAGMVFMDELWAAAHPPHWITYFEVEDCDAAAVRATRLGAKVRVGPATIPIGRYAVLTDPTGARLGIIAPDPKVRRKLRPTLPL